MNPGSVLDVQGVTVRFGGLTALDAVSLFVPPRHVLGVIGPNGAGKTTLLSGLCGFIRPDAGEVRFGGRRPDIRPHRLASLGVARTLQGVGLYGGLTAVENVMVGATCRASAGFWSALLSLPRAGRDERKLREEAMAALDRVGAAGAAQARPGELPYGMRKRIALARALVAKPGLILLDEPAIALDRVNLSAGTAAITAVLGANGAGKTTLLRAVSGMIRPRRGRILLDGADQAGRNPEQMVRAGIAHVPEGQGVIPELTVEENLRVGMMSWPAPARRVPGRSRADRGAALDEAFERFPPLAARRRKLAAALSGGERQMLVIARALLAQ